MLTCNMIEASVSNSAGTVAQRCCDVEVWISAQHVFSQRFLSCSTPGEMRHGVFPPCPKGHRGSGKTGHSRQWHSLMRLPIFCVAIDHRYSIGITDRKILHDAMLAAAGEVAIIATPHGEKFLRSRCREDEIVLALACLGPQPVREVLEISTRGHVQGGKHEDESQIDLSAGCLICLCRGLDAFTGFRRGYAHTWSKQNHRRHKEGRKA